MEWQPIETAPRDGSEFLAYGIFKGDYGYTEDKKDSAFLKWSGGRWVTTKPMGNYFISFTPTHWMPLPNPPA